MYLLVKDKMAFLRAVGAPELAQIEAALQKGDLSAALAMLVKVKVTDTQLAALGLARVHGKGSKDSKAK